MPANEIDATVPAQQTAGERAVDQLARQILGRAIDHCRDHAEPENWLPPGWAGLPEEMADAVLERVTEITKVTR